MVIKLKRLNNRGFAVSTLIYGLSILGLMLITMIMGTLSSTRANSKQIADSIEDDLNNHSRTSKVFSVKGSSDTAQQFTIPEGEGGWYRIELWGAQGNNGNGGKGAYTTGVIKLDEGDTLYFYIGKKGATNAGAAETSVRVDAGEDAPALASRIMVAGGGGRDANCPGTTTKRYKINTGGSKKIDYDSNYIYKISGANLIDEKYSEVTEITDNPETYNKTANDSISGKGYYNGISGFGGTSFISGYAGSHAYSKGAASGSKYTYYEYELDEDSKAVYTGEKRSYVFYDGMMLANVKSGDGYAKVQKVLSTTATDNSLPTKLRQNSKLNNVGYIRVCTKDEQTRLTTTVVAIGENIDTVIPAISTEIYNSSYCSRYKLPTTQSLDEIAVWHNNKGEIGTDYEDDIIQVSSSGSDWQDIKGKANASRLDSNLNLLKSKTETPNGIHISAYQPDYTSGNIKPGNYYIFAVTSSNKVLVAAETEDQRGNALTFTPVNGSNKQVWNIKPIDCKLYETAADKDACNNGTLNADNQEYSITDTVRFNALAIKNDENKVNNQINNEVAFNTYTRNSPQIWRIFSMNNGTYAIKSSAPKFNSTITSGSLMYNSNTAKGDENDSLMIATLESIDVARFYFYKLDY